MSVGSGKGPFDHWGAHTVVSSRTEGHGEKVTELTTPALLYTSFEALEWIDESGVITSAGVEVYIYHASFQN